MPSPIQQALLMASAAGGNPAGAFLTRALAVFPSLDATHQTAYTNLINGLVTDGVWSKFDVLHIYATQASSVALLNLISTSYNGTTHGSLTFTTDRGFTGTDLSTTVYIDTGFNPSSAPSPNYVLNSAHLSAWNLTNAIDTAAPIGGYNASAVASSYILTKYSDNEVYFRINNTGAVPGDGTTISDARGHFIGSRISNSVVNGYINGASYWNNTFTASTLLNQNIFSAGLNGAGTPAGCGNQTAMISVGASLSATDATNFYNRLRTYMTAVGVP